MNYQGRILIRRGVDVVVTVAIAIICLFPILWGLSTSLKPTRDIMAYPPKLIPETISFEHYRTLWDQNILHYVMNSALVSVFTIVACLLIGSLAAYALARFRFKGKGFVMVVIVAVMSVPISSLLVPTFSFMANVQLLNTRLGLVLLYTAYELPMAVWLLSAFFQTIPVELERAAMIDGYSRLQTIRRVVLPLSRTGLVAAGLFVLTFTWNDFVVALVMTTNDSVRTLPIAIYNFLGYYGREWGPLTAGAMVSIIPLIVIFVLFQRYFLSGMTGGSVKG
ncbi:MAG: carbohydrate ABC transporter permease [Chelatococcus sp.]|uniref:carbohydrate ABC transporter permease n=1 Tax=Chelatococcus sp. TaxID=1953771 RepID=UPI0025B90EB5|nr:carbohydrate ABC transporter permease [Chelatococcus sp.]MBX3538594.1 carbohydrate ABC transporter permease [Chelatococcus sp.]